MSQCESDKEQALSDLRVTAFRLAALNETSEKLRIERDSLSRDNIEAAATKRRAAAADDEVVSFDTKQLRRDLAALKEEKEQLVQKVDQLNVASGRMQAEIVQLKDKIFRQEFDVFQSKEEANACTAELEREKKASAQHQREKADLQTVVDRLRQEVTYLQAERDKVLGSSTLDKLTDYGRLEASAASLREKLAETKAELGRAEDVIAWSKQQVGVLQEEKLQVETRLGEQIAQQQTTIEHLAGERDRLLNVTAKMLVDKEVGRLKARLALLTSGSGNNKRHDVDVDDEEEQESEEDRARPRSVSETSPQTPQSPVRQQTNKQTTSRATTTPNKIDTTPKPGK